MKRILVIILAAIIILAVAYFLLSKQEITFTNPKETLKYKAIPIDAPVFIEFNSLNNFPRNNKIFSVFRNSGLFTSFLNIVSRIDSTITVSGDIGIELKDEPVIIVMNLEGKDTFIPLIIVKAETGKKKNDIGTLIDCLFPSNKYQFVRRQYNGENIYDSRSGSAAESFSYSFTNGLFIASPRSIILEKAIRQTNSESLQDDPNFMQINKTATLQAQASVYINHKYFPDFIKNWINPVPLNKVDEFGEERKINHKNSVAGFANYASWSELDLTSKDNELQLYGVSVIPDSVSQYLAIFKRQEAAKVQIDKALPGNTSVFFSYAFNNKKDFFEDFEIFFRHSEVYYSREEKIKRINLISQADLKSIFENIVDNEVAMAFINVPGDPLQKSTCFVVSTKGKSQAKEEINNWLAKYANHQKIRFNEMVSTYEIDKETKFDIYKFPFPSFPGIWLGKPFNSVSADYFTYWDNYIIFANTRNTLENILHDLTLETTLAKDVDYLQFKLKIGNKANINFYLNINNGYSLNKEYFSEDIAKVFKSKDINLRKFGSLSWQVANSNHILFNNIYLNFLDEIKENAKTTWQSNIGANISFKPQLVTDQNNPKKKEIIVQDVNNKLHLINSEGRVKWSIQIPEKIMGEIHQIDFKKNGDLPFLFNTKTKIYLIDQDGNNVSPYPLVLRSPATNGISVFDYDNNHNYRYFIAGEDKRIYAYESSGKVLPGWNFGQTDQVVTTPVQHFRVDAKDFILFKDKARIYVMDRKGQARFKIASRFENSRNPIILNISGIPKMVVTDIKGTVYYLYFNGKITQKKTSGFSENHFFTLSDINENGVLDFVFVDKDELTVIDENGAKIFSSKFKNVINYPPSIYSYSSKMKKIGVVNRNENRIYLFNPDGSLFQGFPLKGNSEFCIGQITSGAKYFNLIVGSNDGNICNYRVD